MRRTVKVAGRVDDEGVRRFDIRLPATVVSGVVRKEDGTAEPHAVVTLDSNEGDDFEQAFTREDGSFEIPALEPGRYRLSAQAFLTRSDILDVKLEESAEFELVLRSEVEIRGRVVMGTVPVIGADVRAIPRGVRFQLGPHGKSDAAGRFALYLPPGTETYDIAVIPRGFYVSIGRLTVTRDKIVRAEIAQDGGALNVEAPAEQYVRLLREGAEFSLEMLARESAGTVEKTTDGQRLGIANLEPGMYSVCGDKKCVSAYVPRWGSAAVSLR